MVISYGSHRNLIQDWVLSGEVHNKQYYLIDVGAVVAERDGQGLTGSGSDRVSSCDGNAFILIEPWVTQTYAFVKTYHTVHVRSVHLRECKLYCGQKKLYLIII